MCNSLIDYLYVYIMRNYQVQGNLFKQESQLCEFLIIIPLSKYIQDQVKTYKEEFEVLFGGFRSRYSIPHITVCDFLLFEHRTLDAISLFQKRFEQVPSFKLQIFDFSSFPTSKTIYLHVEKSNNYNQLLIEVDRTRKMLHLRKNYFQSNTPHITIAKNLSPEVFHKAKEMFKKRSFSSTLEVKTLEVLKLDLISRRYHHFGSITLKEN